jgi:hypothetical protein
MNIKELKKTKISDLSPEQVESRIEFLSTVPYKETLKYLRYVLDREYVLAPTESESISNEKVSNFLKHSIFEKFRHLIFDTNDELQDDFVKLMREE